MLKRKIHPQTCLRLLRVAWSLMAILIVVALLGFRGIVPLSAVGAATVILGGIAMTLTFLAAEHSGELTNKEERDVLDDYIQHHRHGV